MKTLMVRYRTSETQAEANAALVRAVFDELRASAPQGLRYASYRLADGVTFVHIATLDNPAENPLVALASFKAFQRQLAERCVEAPAVAELSPLDSYGLEFALDAALRELPLKRLEGRKRDERVFGRIVERRDVNESHAVGEPIACVTQALGRARPKFVEYRAHQRGVRFSLAFPTFCIGPSAFSWEGLRSRREKAKFLFPSMVTQMLRKATSLRAKRSNPGVVTSVSWRG